MPPPRPYLVKGIDRPDSVAALFESQMVVKIHHRGLDARNVSASPRLAIQPGEKAPRREPRTAP